MGYFPVRYDSRVVNYDGRGFIRLATSNTIYIGAEPPKMEAPWWKLRNDRTEIDA